MYCQKCGKQLDDDSKFCAYCGAKFSFKVNEDEINRKSFCQDCEVYSEGDFCKKCGKKKQEKRMDFHKNVTAFFVGITILISGVLCFVSSIFTLLSDLSEDDYWSDTYTYTAPLTSHEKSVLFFIFVGIIGIFIGVIMVASNKIEAVYMNKAYEPIAYVAYTLTVIAILYSLVSIIPYFSVCDRCGGLTFGRSYSDLFDEITFCRRCYDWYWGN